MEGYFYKRPSGRNGGKYQVHFTWIFFRMDDVRGLFLSGEKGFWGCRKGMYDFSSGYGSSFCALGDLLWYQSWVI